MPCRFQLTSQGHLRCYHCGRTFPLRKDRTSRKWKFGGSRLSTTSEAERFENIPRPGVIRVGAYYPNVYVGGAENWLRLLFRNLPPDDFSITGVCVEGRGRLPAIDFSPIKVSFDLPGLVVFSDVLLAWGVKSLQHVRKQFDGPIIYIGHSGRELLGMGERLANHATHHVAVSQSCLPSIPVPFRQQALVIHNGIEPMALPSREEARAKLGIGGQTVVGFVGRWSPEKDPLAAARAVSAMPEAIALYHGYRKNDEHLFREEVRRLTQGRAIFRGTDASVAETYAALDCFIHTPRFEGFGLTYCEAWQAGVPVVSSFAGVVAECGRAHDVATIVEPDLPGPNLAAAVRYALSGHTVEAGRQLVSERFTAAQMGQRWGSFLRNVVGSFDDRSIQRECSLR